MSSEEMWKEIFKEAEGNYEIYRTLNDLSSIVLELQEIYERINYSKYRFINSTSFEIKEVQQNWFKN